MATELHNIRQEHKTIDDYAKTIENLFLNLTLTQADGNEASTSILRNVNENLAINAFSNGLRNGELRTIIKARNYSTLKDAIVGAKGEEIIKNSNPVNNAFHFHHYNQQNRNVNRGNRGHRYFNNVNKASNNNSRFNGKQYHANNGQQKAYNYRGQVRGGTYRQERGRTQNRRRGYHTAYFLDSNNTTYETNASESTSAHNNEQKRFFRF